MATNLALEDELIQEAQEIGQHRTINAALKEYIEHHRQLRIIESFDKVLFAKDYDYKKQRNRK